MALTVASASTSICNMILSIMALRVAFAFTSIFNIILILCIVASIIIMALTVASASASASISNMILSIMALTLAFPFTSIFNIILILCIVASIIIMALTLASASTSISASAPSNSASTSSSASAPSNYRYDVFLNHYGDDVKNNFASHLYERLRSHGLQVFLDQPEMQRGETIEPQIEGAIASASVQVAIFSPGYAKSRWCLDELVSMLRSKATVIPVFFKVKPCEVRRPNAGAKGLYAKAIADHEKKDRYTPARIADWREALEKASKESGYELERCKGVESELVDQVARQVLKKARLAPLHVATHPIGLDEELQDFERTVLLEKQQNRGPPIILITGSGGVGKTTLVKAFFNKYRLDYERCCFLAEVRISAMKNKLTSLQRQLCKDFNLVTLEMRNIPEGTGKLEHYCSCSQSLIILDDVDSTDQLNALLSPVKDRLPPGSLILVTSRDKSVLREYEEFSIYHMKGLGRDHSQQLFCWYSFNCPHPAEGYKELVGWFLDLCNGLPLSLREIGLELRSESRVGWEAQLRKRTRVLHPKIKNTLMISYDSLDEEEKEIFIDSACLFIGIKAETAIRVWFGSGWEGYLGLRTLQNKCLVEVDSEGCINLHNHLRDLGRNLADKGPLQCGFRIWCATDNRFRNVRDQSTVRGISMVPQCSGESFQSLGELSNDIDVDVNRLQLLRAPVDCLESLFNRMKQPKLVWLRCEIYPHVSQPISILFNNSEFSLPSWWIPLEDLRVLEVVNRIRFNEYPTPVWGTLWPENEAQLPLQLRELNISAELRHLPESIRSLKNLEKIELHNFKGTLPDGFFYLGSLQYLKLRAPLMNNLSEDFGNLKSLLHLDLSGCDYLPMLPSSLRNLTELQHMSLSGCRGLQMLPPFLGDLRELQHMDLSKCRNLKTLPDSFMKLIRLKYLDLSDCTEVEERSILGVWELNNLEYLNLYHCPISVVPFAGVEEVQGARRLSDCMSRLKFLDLSGARITEISFGKGVCPVLQDLNLSGCLELMGVGALPTSLKSLCLMNCGALKRITGLSGLEQLESLNIFGCGSIEELPGLETLISLKKLYIDRSMEKIWALAEAANHRVEFGF